jgi:hypothetical protein
MLEFPRPLVDQLAACVEQFVNASDVGFGLRHRGDIQKDERTVADGGLIRIRRCRPATR